MKRERAEERISDLLHWTWSCQLQLQRYGQSLRTEFSGGSSEDRRKVYSQTSYDEHMVLVAARHLLSALERAGTSLPRIALSDSNLEVLELLRNAYEHWPTERTKFRAGVKSGRGAVAELAQNHANARPWSVDLTPEGPVLARVVPLREFASALDQLEDELLKYEQHFSTASRPE